MSFFYILSIFVHVDSYELVHIKCVTLSNNIFPCVIQKYNTFNNSDLSSELHCFYSDLIIHLFTVGCLHEGKCINFSLFSLLLHNIIFPFLLLHLYAFLIYIRFFRRQVTCSLTAYVGKYTQRTCFSPFSIDVVHKTLVFFLI